jgi:ABC-type lipoprotein export system ATPase subunit
VSAVALEGLSHHYAGNPAKVFDGLSVEFGAGQMCALMGPSGSGKSTLLSLIGLVMRPTGGRIVVGGLDAWRPKRHASWLRRVAFAWVLQNTACLDARTAIDNVAVGLMAQGVATRVARTRAVEALGEVGLADRAGARASELSGGEAQRMTIARAMLSDRPIVLADEPTGQLDAANSAAVTEALRACARAGRAVIVATHDPSVAEQCDYIVRLPDGQRVTPTTHAGHMEQSSWPTAVQTDSAASMGMLGRMVGNDV